VSFALIVIGYLSVKTDVAIDLEMTNSIHIVIIIFNLVEREFSVKNSFAPANGKSKVQ